MAILIYSSLQDHPSSHCNLKICFELVKNVFFLFRIFKTCLKLTNEATKKKKLFCYAILITIQQTSHCPVSQFKKSLNTYIQARWGNEIVKNCANTFYVH